MADDGFASGLWKNVQAIKLGQDGGIEAPVRADGRNGIVGGVDAIAKMETRPRADVPPTRRSLLARILRRK